MDKIGPTGTYPDGKICIEDEGALLIEIGRKHGYVIIKFGKQIEWLGMTPKQAIDIAHVLIENAVDEQ